MTTNEELLKRDICDLVTLCNAEECYDCGRFYVPGFICPWCDADNSVYDEDY